MSYDVHVTRDVMVVMRDGVRLATDVYRPAQGGILVEDSFPVILERTPYGKGKHSRSEIDVDRATTMPPLELASYFVSSGYVVVFQDCRGRHGSEGTFEKYTAEAEERLRHVPRNHAQIFCNGRIGTMGLSYAAHTQAALAAALNPPGRRP